VPVGATQEREHVVAEQVADRRRQPRGGDRHVAIVAEQVLDGDEQVAQVGGVRRVHLVERDQQAGRLLGEEVAGQLELVAQAGGDDVAVGAVPRQPADADRPDHGPQPGLAALRIEVGEDRREVLGHQPRDEARRRGLLDHQPAALAGDVGDLVEHHRLAGAAGAGVERGSSWRARTVVECFGELFDDIAPTGEHGRRIAERRPERVRRHHAGDGTRRSEFFILFIAVHRCRRAPGQYFGYSSVMRYT
jgi:hypothetical protein